MDQTAAIITFFALGANLLGALLLLLLNPRNLEIRWYTAFQAALLLWLFSQGMLLLTDDSMVWRWPFTVAVTFMPGLFASTALVEDRSKRTARAWLPVVGAIAVLPFAFLTSFGNGHLASRLLFVGWQIAGWGTGTAMLWRSTDRGRLRHGRPLVPERLLMTLLLAAPVAVVIGIILSSGFFFTYAMPVITVVIQLLLFVGVTRMRFYDIDVRVARTGEVAAGAAESERLAVLGELAATIAHEVRNPLTGVRSLAQRIAEEDVDESKRRRYASVILDEVGRVERIVENLLGVARRPRRNWNDEETELAPLFDDLALLTRTLAQRAAVTVHFEANELRAGAPRDPVAQALLNLLLNAIRHAPAHSEVHVRADRRGDGVAISVRDHGAGVPEQDRDRIFEPFWSGSNGTGLGLSVVRSLARQLEWRIELDEPEDGGARFTIHVPAAAHATAVTR